MNKKKVLISLIFIALLLSGCGDKSHYEKPQIRVSDYEKITYETVEVIRGDIEPTLTLKLETDGFERKTYFPSQDNMKVEQVYVQEGDMVKAGDLLISFESGDIQEQIESYQSRLKEDELLIEHYTNLSTIDSSLDYSADIQMLKEDIEIANLYISDLRQKLDGYSIRAEKTGMVSLVSEMLDYGVVNAADGVICLIYGSGDYYGYTTDDYDFSEGDVYTANFGVATYDMEVVGVDIADEAAVDDVDEASDGILRKISFKFKSDDASIVEVDSLNMVIKKEVLKDVLYLPKKCVFYVNDESYVYLLDEQGFRHGVEVKVGYTVDGYTVIEEGLSEGDKVVIK